ncbi:hypothetical protein LEP1GSC186_1517 [Leptospira noguchii serovar Autumnalis str. ZUN142]|uniref:Uncharacterized protein n=2 Tax=Leptospira noguchii TaxID=28182 RepID=M6YWQ5_9LEPT|nr:hypothetical protein LEP1GSC186_1517 [Leptospira noguchii serovar Autumnalis str. ZUN142]EMO90808.1 hypothetical protein LEP1GSC024_1800 [Leptospira noguchii str. 2001034031]
MKFLNRTEFLHFLRKNKLSERRFTKKVSNFKNTVLKNLNT